MKYFVIIFKIFVVHTKPELGSRLFQVETLLDWKETLAGIRHLLTNILLQLQSPRNSTQSLDPILQNFMPGANPTKLHAWSQSYNPDLQRQRCKSLQRHA
jgi:hypothetical protein